MQLSSLARSCAFQPIPGSSSRIITRTVAPNFHFALHSAAQAKRSGLNRLPYPTRLSFAHTVSAAPDAYPSRRCSSCCCSNTKVHGICSRHRIPQHTIMSVASWLPQWQWRGQAELHPTGYVVVRCCAAYARFSDSRVASQE